MTGFILVVAGLMLLLYLLQRRKPARNRAHFSYGYPGVASGETTNDYSGAGGEFGGAGAGGDWESSGSSGSDGAGGGGD